MIRTAKPLSVERLEDRDVPSTAVLLGTNNNLYRIDTSNSGALSPAIPITGLPAGYHVEAIDFRASDNTHGLYGLIRNGDSARIVRIDALTGKAVDTSNFTTALPVASGLAGNALHYDIDFIPGTGVMRAVGSNRDNFQINVLGFAFNNSTALTAGSSIQAIASANNADINKPSATYGIDPNTDKLVKIGDQFSTISGVVTVVGSLTINVEANGNLGFDIGNDGKAFAVMTDNLFSRAELYTIDLVSGAATLVGQIGDGTKDFQGLALLPTHLTAVGADASGGPAVHVYDSTSGALKYSFFAYGAKFTGGVRVAVGDVNRDGIDDIVTAAGPGGGPQVRVFSGKDGSLMGSFFAYDQKFTGGAYVAVGDVNHDGYDDIITGPGKGGGPQVRVFSGEDFSVLQSYFAYGAKFAGGVRVAAGYIDTDQNADVITAPGPGGGPNVKVFSGKDGSLLRSFMAYGPAVTTGVYVAAGDMNSDGFSDIITGTGEGSAPNIKVFSGEDNTLLSTFLAGPANATAGWRVGSADADGNGVADILVAPGPGGAPNLKAYTLAGTLLETSPVFAPAFQGGVFVG